MKRMAQVAGLVVAGMVLLVPTASAEPVGDRYDFGAIAGSMVPGACVVAVTPGGGPSGPSVTFACPPRG
ncbi:hypothetical protein SAMN05216188_1218 [Lentzea xinjiangensis]|uniref:Secreted protein n=1 Tax=Lentzea xinjiangensis TaxID=402600 RepID=A0A1H9UBU2_9PSEU|nr:hypothetical protein [Lentzea xinjiangensis]SES06802.1 hypothetical protein SAMN05216188_1218 [Lentzea xinjiangensis]